MKRLRQFALLAVVGQIVLLGSAWLMPLASEYGLVGDNISELVLGRYGWVQTLTFVISGLGIIGLAYAIYRLTSGARGSRLGPLLIGIYGFGAVVVAIFPTDRIDSRADVYSQSVFGWIHSLTAAVCFLCVVVGMFVQMEGPWVGFLHRLLITAIGGWLLLVATRVRTIASTRKTVPGEVGEIYHSAS